MKQLISRHSWSPAVRQVKCKLCAKEDTVNLSGAQYQEVNHRMQSYMIWKHVTMPKIHFLFRQKKNPKQICLCMQYHTKGHNGFSCQRMVTELQIPISYYDVPCGFIYLNSVLQLKRALLIKRHFWQWRDK